MLRKIAFLNMGAEIQFEMDVPSRGQTSMERFSRRTSVVRGQFCSVDVFSMHFSSAHSFPSAIDSGLWFPVSEAYIWAECVTGKVLMKDGTNLECPRQGLP